MKLRSFCIKLAVAAALTIAAPRVYAQDGLAGAFARSSLVSSSNMARPFGRTLAAADFDNDNKPDGAVLVDNGWAQPRGLRTIEVHLTGRPNTALTFESADLALSVWALDVNRDGATDIVVEQPFTHKRLQIWLNDGRGDFRQARGEDFAAPELSSRQGLDSPWQSPDSRVVWLPQRGSDNPVLSSGFLPLHAPEIAQLQAGRIDSPPMPQLFSPAPPRAPPFLLSH